MKKIIFVFYLLSLFFNTNTNINEPHKAEFVYLPEDVIVVNTLDKNGVFTLVNNDGNGVDIYVENAYVDLQDKIDDLKHGWVVNKISNLKNEDFEFNESISDVFRIDVDDVSKVGNVFSIILMRKNDYIITAFFVKPENLHTYDAFEVEILTVLNDMKGEINHEEAQIWNFSRFINYGRQLSS